MPTRPIRLPSTRPRWCCGAWCRPAPIPDSPLADLLRERGGGLRLSTGAHIPLGSGLGTSSILAGAVLAALSTWHGMQVEGEERGAR